MNMTVTHATQATGTNAGNGDVHKEQWNEPHLIELDPAASGQLQYNSGGTITGTAGFSVGGYNSTDDALIAKIDDNHIAYFTYNAFETHLIDSTSNQMGAVLPDVIVTQFTNDSGTFNFTQLQPGQIQLAKANTTAGHSTSITLKGPDPGTGAINIELTLPDSVGASGQVLSTDGTGVLTWSERAAATAPASATAAGRAGEVRYDGDYVYVCVAGNSWKRAALSSW